MFFLALLGSREGFLDPAWRHNEGGIKINFRFASSSGHRFDLST
jgi:hypothetical protein